MYYTMTMMEPHQRSTKWWRLLPMNDTVQGTSSCEGKVSMKCMKLTNSLFQVFCQWHCYCWVWKSRYLQKWNSARYEKRYNLIKKHLIKFSNQILLCAIIYLFNVKRFNLVETFDNKWKFPTQEITMIHFLNAQPAYPHCLQNPLSLQAAKKR